MQPSVESRASDHPVSPHHAPIRRAATSRVQTLLLAAILLIGASLRLYNIAWDQGTLPHPDERSTVAFYAPSIRWPDKLSDALDPRRSSLNPFWDVRSGQRRSYTYGHFPLYTLVLTADLAKQLAPLADWLGLPEPLTRTLAEARSMMGYAYIGRFLMAVADTFTVYLVYLLGRRLYGRWAGLLAAAFSAFTVLQIQLAHFFAVDPVSTTFTLLALYGSLHIYDRRGPGAAVLTGVGIGLAVASKYSALPIVAAPVVAAVLSVTRAEPDERDSAGRLAFRNLLIAGVVSFGVFAVTSPFVLLDFKNFWQAVVKEQGDMVTGVADFPFTRQYRGTSPYVYFILQQLQWGMGWPLGLLAFAGLAWVLARALLGRAQPGEWILLSWVILYFGPTGLFLAKFMRYMVPVVPLFVLFGAGLVLSTKSTKRGNGESPSQPVDKSVDQPSAPLMPYTSAEDSYPQRGLMGQKRLISYARLVIVLIALLGGTIWSLAFVNGVYGTPHSWITASRWVYEHIPDGACIAAEHWEEGFPRTWAEHGMSPGAHSYRQPLLPMYEADTRQKFETIRDTLLDCDYLVLASNRLWRTIPKLPQRYPMSTRYYQALFDGELGFEQVYSLSTPPRLGKLVIDDQAADESFTVYDHPRPIIFKKTSQLSAGEWEALLGDRWQTADHGYIGSPTLLARLRGQVPRTPKPVSTVPGSEPEKSLLLDRPVDQLPVVNDYHWNTLANRSAVVAIVVWWLAMQVVGWLAWPLAYRVFHRLPDRGYLLAKGLGWLLVGYGVWLASSLGVLRNSLPTAVVALVAMGAIAVWLVGRNRYQDSTASGNAPGGDDATSGPVAGKRGCFHSLFPASPSLSLILVGEVVFTGVYLYFVGLRLLNPDLWQPWNGGEKMLEIGFLNAIVKSAHMPPYDPYFAGGYINYYYYGLFLVGVLIKLTGIQPTIAFNLAVPTLAALTAGGVFSLGYNLAYRPYRRETGAFLVAGLAVLLVILVGNLAGFTQLVRMLGEHGRSNFESAIPGLEAVVRALTGLKSIWLEGTKLQTYNYWDPSRVIPDTINEFPYWSFLFADLHPHMIGMPFTVLFLSLAYNWLRPARGATSRSLNSAFLNLHYGQRQLRLGIAGFLRTLAWGNVFRWLALPFCLGALATINTWDLPTYLGVITLTFWLVRYRRGAREASPSAGPGISRLAVYALEAILFGALTLATSYLLYLPFFAHYQPLDVGLGLVHDKTNLGQFVKMWGLPLFILVSYLLLTLVYPASRMGALRVVSLFLRRWNVAPHLSRVFRALVRAAGAGYRAALWSLVIVVVVAIGLWLLGYKVPGLLLPLVWLSFLFLLRPEPDAGHTFAGLLLFTGLLILLGVEFFFLRDFLGGGPNYRMNTLFKFYIQVWVMLGVAAAYLLVGLLSAQWMGHRLPPDRMLVALRPIQNWRWTALSWLWQLVIMLLIVAVLAYPLLGTPSRVRDRFDRSPPIGTLDGMAYMTTGTLVWPPDNPIELKYDYQAIRWLQVNVKGTPVLAEARLGYYREGGMRVASYTGLPMPLGGLHQNEQRWPDQVGKRDGLYMEFWNTTDPARAWELIQELDISYIYIGQLEQTLYDPDLAGTLVQWGVPFLRSDAFYKFGELKDQGRLRVVYENERVRIYQVTDINS
jgi:YYY domain-containing protein